MEKVDAVTLRAKLFAEYRDYPNPTNDPVLAFEHRAAGVIADFAVLMVQEHNERQTPDPVLIEGVAAIASVMMAQVIGFAPEHIQSKIIAHALGSLETYLIGQRTAGQGEVEIPTKNVGDA